MKKLLSIFFLFALISMLFLQCKKDPYDPDAQKIYNLSYDLPNLELSHDTYYKLGYDDRSIEINFNEDIDETSVAGNISFSDNSGFLDSFIEIAVNRNIMMIGFHQDFILKDGWKYELIFAEGFKSISGDQLTPNTVIELRTSSRPIHEYLPGTGFNVSPPQRFLIACISDIHMGDNRSAEKKYGWFGKNKEAMENFLDFVIHDSIVKELVILGDLFDEWIVPFTITPFDTTAGVNSNVSYFKSVANADVNKEIIKKLRDIALNPDIDLKYVPGNHDMLLTKGVLDSIIPGIHWMGGVQGLGKYEPVNGIVLEHGHRYDFFNSPQPYITQGKILPPGYFISRLYAEGTMYNNTSIKDELAQETSEEFRLAWWTAYHYVIFSSGMPKPDETAKIILTGGIDGFDELLSFNGVEDMYAANIETNWIKTQKNNQVPYPNPSVFIAIWNGHSDLYRAAKEQYMYSSTAPKQYKVVAFGHTHEPELKLYSDGKYKAIYANSGSWVDNGITSYDTRTFLMINPGEWSGSDLDVVSLYQYNKNTGSGPKYAPVRKAEESVHK